MVCCSSPFGGEGVEPCGKQPSKEVEKRGPAVSAAFDAEGKPTKAAEGWAKGCGITVEQAERIATDKGEWLVHRAVIEGQRLKICWSILSPNRWRTCRFQKRCVGAIKPSSSSALCIP
ncbi:Glycine--tRNA ligase beta subunit [Mannheimia haemolytica]|uniref:Glycine--tRNA ligase beta subunit n=1 Tax=Mannheimia haemolytica TaxID=75985 RepID=A0A378MX22_MANHA|nr:Glycine--tRNA ligase beta subunit [Mannheimia haemolytica]